MFFGSCVHANITLEVFGFVSAAACISVTKHEIKKHRVLVVIFTISEDILRNFFSKI
jgi:hypothetical protein